MSQKSKSYRGYILILEEFDSEYCVLIYNKSMGGGTLETSDLHKTSELAFTQSKNIIDKWLDKK